MPAPTTISSLRFCDVPLCVECLSCGRRTAIEAADLARAAGDEMTSLVALSRRLRCSQCPSGATRCFRPIRRTDVAAFLAGGPLQADSID